MRILSPSSGVPTLPPPPSATPDVDPDERMETTDAKTPRVAPTVSTVPTVVLDIDVVSDNMAARLCIGFLSHVLFLKNQIPFPVVQLARMPISDNATRTAKKRQELLNSFDTLASHLYTTFISLSTALALRGTPEKVKSETEHLYHRQPYGAARAFLTVAFGPTAGTAKSRVIVGIDGLETKVWGLREDSIPDKTTPADDEEIDEGSLDDASDTDDEDERNEDVQSGGSSQDEVDISGSDGDVPPPLSRSPSPAPSSNSDASPQTAPQNLQSKLSQVRTEDPETVRAAERLLSRTLASACAEGDGNGLASEIAPTQMHVLLRAPRRFDHPCWIPRQNLCTSLDSSLDDFLVKSGETPTSAATKKRTKSSKVQGLWIKSRGGNIPIDTSSEGDPAEEDELIWWSWDGKLVGFADW